MARYYCVRDCVFNKLHWRAYQFYEDYQREAAIKGKPWSVWEDCSQGQQRGQGVKRKGSKYMIQVFPKPKERQPYELDLIAKHIEEMEGTIQILQEAAKGGKTRGAEAKIRQIESTIRELRSA